MPPIPAELDGLEGPEFLRAAIKSEEIERIAVISSFGAESAALLHMAVAIDPDLPVIYLDIWHTTGSGKTLTSFKASTLLKTNESIHKCLFVVDRKDLDRQTRDEFNRFQENCVEENTNTETLVRRLLSGDYADKVIVTTIQKLGLALDENSKHNKKNIARGQSTTWGSNLIPLVNTMFLSDSMSGGLQGQGQGLRADLRLPRLRPALDQPRLGNAYDLPELPHSQAALPAGG